MGHKTTDLGLVDRKTQTTELPETIAKNKKRSERDKSREMRRFFEQQREEQELEKQLKDPFDYADYDD
jgi:hypothetical protein